jgi:hypothetical protein
LCDALIEEQKRFYHGIDIYHGMDKALDSIGWQTERSEAGAAYWLAKGQYDKVTQIGAPAIPGLVALLRYSDGEPESNGKSRGFNTRKAAASALVSIYKSGQLSDEQKRLILAQRQKIMQKHSDIMAGGHSKEGDWDGHSDQGLGVAFPL